MSYFRRLYGFWKNGFTTDQDSDAYRLSRLQGVGIVPIPPPVLESVTMTGPIEITGDHDVTMPTERPDGDLYLTCFYFSGAFGAPTVPGTWTLEFNSDPGNANFDRMMVYSFVGSSEPATYSVTPIGNRFISAVLRFSGSSLVFDVADANTVESPSDGNISAPDVTATGTSATVIRLFSENSNNPFLTAPSGVTLQDSVVNADASLYVYTDDSPSLPDTGVVAAEFDGTNRSKVGTTLVVKN